jgi:AcrR family transcriptional regulator
MRAATSPMHAPPRRRTQAERRHETRSKIVEAVVASIAEVGFQRTTATRIAARAGVTWGAVQHHYGGKDGILVAVLDDTFARFAAHFDDMPDPAATPLATRARLFVERAWAHFGSAHFRSMFEILLQAFGGDDGERDTPGEQQLRLHDGLDRLWRRIFPDAPLPRQRRTALESYTIATLMGLALQLAIAGGPSPQPKAEIALLARTLATELEVAARARAARSRARNRLTRVAVGQRRRARRRADAG